MQSVYVETAPSRLFAFPPAPLPALVPAPSRDLSLLHPFNIPPETYLRVMNISLPITVGTVYATSVWWLNRVNKRRKYKPWRFSRSTAFLCFVVAHNIALAIFSGWVAIGMFRAISTLLPPRGSPAGAAANADALCKMHGPRGYGNAVFFDPVETRWMTLSRSVQLLNDTPDPADLGRLWNEALGYYGWVFYLSKFYEVVDTMIILAKGKKSSLLQTYHHTGAMIGMWAGMRYMSPPIWCFVQVNSFIHTIMYSYYAASALGLRAPMLFKRTLTSMQIAQLVFGASYALLHLIIAYDVPVETPYLVRREIPATLPHVTSSVIAASLGPDLGTFLKKLALRAAGGEGLAKNIGKTYPSLLPQPVSAAKPSPHVEEEIKYSWQTVRVPCIDTSGEVFAILLNVMYLLPLIYLFVRFFVRSYLRRAERPKAEQPDGTAARLRASSTDAVKGIQREIREAIMATQGSYSDLDLSKTPTSSARSTITTPSTTSAPRSGASTPPTIKPFAAAPVIDESSWLGAGKGSSKIGKKSSPRASPPTPPSPSPNEPRVDEVPQVLRSQNLAQDAQPSLSVSSKPGSDTDTKERGEVNPALDTNGYTETRESSERVEDSQPKDVPHDTEQNESIDTSEPDESLSEIMLDEPTETDKPNGISELGVIEKNFETDAHDITNEVAETSELGEVIDNDEADAQAEKAAPEDSTEDVTASTLTIPRASSSPSPSESRRNAEEAVRRAYEAADMATRRASEDDAESIISVETTFTIESMANESLTEARRYEIPGVDEALDLGEQEAERELQPDVDG